MRNNFTSDIVARAARKVVARMVQATFTRHCQSASEFEPLEERRLMAKYLVTLDGGYTRALTSNTTFTGSATVNSSQVEASSALAAAQAQITPSSGGIVTWADQTGHTSPFDEDSIAEEYGWLNGTVIVVAFEDYDDNDHNDGFIPVRVEEVKDKQPNSAACTTCPPTSVTTVPQQDKHSSSSQQSCPTSSKPVNYFTGKLKYETTDLGSEGFGRFWGHTRSWTTDARQVAANVNGTGFEINQLPSITQLPDGRMQMRINGPDSYYYTQAGEDGPWEPSYTIKHDFLNTPAEWTHIDTMGNVTKFYGFDPDQGFSSAFYGKFKSYTDRTGNVTTAEYDTSAKLTRIVRSQIGSEADSTQTFQESFEYSWSGTLMSNVALKQRQYTTTGGTPTAWTSITPIRQVSYEYYGTNDDQGRNGDLKFAIIKNGAGTEIERKYYRYWMLKTVNGFAVVGSNKGRQGDLKMVVEGEAWSRLAAKYSSNVTTQTDEVVKLYADNYLEYDTLGRVILERAQGAGCSSCSAGQGEYTYSYSKSGLSDGLNIWNTKCTETLPDGSTNTIYMNFVGQQIMKVFTDVATSNKSYEWNRYDSQGQIIRQATNSVITGISETLSDLVGYQSETTDAATKFAIDKGHIVIFTYGATDSATETSAGDVEGYLKGKKIRNVADDTVIELSARTYYQRVAANGGVYSPVASIIEYETENGSSTRQTAYSYTWKGTSAQVQRRTTTLPTATTAQNGPDDGTSNGKIKIYEEYDSSGRIIWTKDGDGYIHYVQYDPFTGEVTKAIRDVNTSDTSVTNEPTSDSEFVTKSGAGLHLVTTTLVDAFGRPEKIVDPNGNVTWRRYDDVNHESRTYNGVYVSGSTWKATAPIQIVRQYRNAIANYDLSGNGTIETSEQNIPVLYTEMLTLKPSAANGHFDTNGKPTGTETIDATTIFSLTRSLTNSAGQVVELDEYTNLISIAYSQSTPRLYNSASSPTTLNFGATLNGYNNRGRLSRVRGADGTWMHTVYDGMGRVLSEWKGTNNTGWTHTDPSGGGTSGNNMVKTSENVYDNDNTNDIIGLNLIESKRFGNASTVYSTHYQYDYRNRLTASRGPDNVATFYILDNLDRRIWAIEYADADADFDYDETNERRRQSRFYYDKQGRAYKSLVYKVGTSTDATPGYSDIYKQLTTLSWYDRRGNLIKSKGPSGLFEKNLFDGGGRNTATYTSYQSNESDTVYADADDVVGDTVIEQVKTVFDRSGRPATTTSYKRLETDTSSTAELTALNSFVQTGVTWHDRANRVTSTVNFGRDNGATRYIFNTSGAIIDADNDLLPDEADFDKDGNGTAYESGEASRAVDSSDDYLVTAYEYDNGGRRYRVIDNMGRITQNSFDWAGKTTKVVENFVDGNSDAGDREEDRVTTYSYDLFNRLTSIKAYRATSSAVTTQQTSYIYGSVIDGSWVTKTVYPDSTALTLTNTKTVTLAKTNGVVTATSTSHGFSVNDMIKIAGATGDYRHNGWFVITSVTTNAFTFVVPNDWGTPTGSAVTASKLSSTDLTACEYDRLGRQVTCSDQQGITHTFTYDSAGRLSADSVGNDTLPSGVDGLIRTIAHSYDDAGRNETITSKDASGAVLNQIKYTYDGWGNVITEEQDLDSIVGVSGGIATKSIQYVYDDGAATAVSKFVRLASVIYPSGVTRYFNYPFSGIGSVLNRVDNVDATDSGGSNQLIHFEYMGADTIVRESHPILGTSDHILERNTSGSYEGWDRFFRVVNQRWRNAADNYNYDQYQYAYDRNSNVVTKQYNSSEGHSDVYDESYTYDSLNRLTKINRGNLSSGTIADSNATFSQSWTLDTLGNWSSFSEDMDGAGGAAVVTHTRTVNDANEITDISDTNWTDPTYDSAGNMTRNGKGDSLSTALGFVYDGWNRQVGVDANNDGDLYDDSDYRYVYDGVGRRVTKIKDTQNEGAGLGDTSPDNDEGTAEYFYYNDNYQVLEVYAGAVASGTVTLDNDVKERYLWNVTYIDAPIVAEFDTNTDGTTDNQLWALYDANYNVTTIIDILSSAAGAERYIYTPYGQRTIMSGTYASRSTSSYGWTLGHQGLRLDVETGNYYSRARYLSSSFGVFGQRDAEMYADSLNLYAAYVLNPVNERDPSGRSIIENRIGNAVDYIFFSAFSSWKAASVNRDLAQKSKEDKIIQLASAGGADAKSVDRELRLGGMDGFTTASTNLIQGTAGATSFGVGLGGPVVCLGRGSTANLAKGTWAASNLREKLAVQQAAQDAAAGSRLPIKMSDSRWLASEGWVKMERNVVPKGGQGISQDMSSDAIKVHYVYNTVTKAVDDFKIVKSGARP